MIERPLVLSDDARAILTAAASGAARTNKPRWLIYLGAVAVLIALAYTGYNLTRRVAAEHSLSSRQAQYSEVKAEVDKLMAIKAADDALGGDHSAPDLRMADNIGKVATNMGLTIATVSEGDDSRGTTSKVVKRKRYDYKFSNQPADLIFTWLQRVTSQFAGIQVYRIDISPADGNDGIPGWNVLVTFTRWERAS